MLLMALSPYAMTESGWKLLEYMTRRGRIHDLNLDSLLISLLPYHETLLFKRVLLVAKVSSSDRWSFLTKAQTVLCQSFNEMHESNASADMYERGIFVTREFLVKRMSLIDGGDSTLLAMVEDYIREYLRNPLLVDHISLTRLMSFWTTLVIEIFHSLKGKKLTKKFKRQPHLLREEWKQILTRFLDSTVLSNLRLLLELDESSAKTAWKFSIYTVSLVLLKTIGFEICGTSDVSTGLQMLFQGFPESISTPVIMEIEALVASVGTEVGDAEMNHHDDDVTEEPIDEVHHPSDVEDDVGDAMDISPSLSSHEQAVAFLRKCPLKAQVFVKFIEAHISLVESQVQENPSRKKHKKPQVVKASPKVSLKALLNYLSEIDLTTLQDYYLLLSPLFALLEQFRLEDDSAIKDIELQLQVQSCFVLIYLILKSMSLEDVAVEDISAAMKFQLLVSFVSASNFSLKTSLLALECLAQAVHLFASSSNPIELEPSIIELIMPVFVFMSKSLTSCDDQYTFHVLESCIQMLVPAILTRAASYDSSMNELWTIFSGAFDSIPVHRRPLIYRTLMKSCIANCALPPNASVAADSVEQNGRSSVTKNESRSLAQCIVIWTIALNSNFPGKEKSRQVKSFLIEQLLMPLINEKDVKVVSLLESFFLLIEDFYRLIEALQASSSVAGKDASSLLEVIPNGGESFGCLYDASTSKWHMTMEDHVLRNSIEFVLTLFDSLIFELPKIKAQLRTSMMQLYMPKLVQFGLVLKQVSLLQETALMNGRNKNKHNGRRLEWHRTCLLLESLIKSIGLVLAP